MHEQRARYYLEMIPHASVHLRLRTYFSYLKAPNPSLYRTISQCRASHSPPADIPAVFSTVIFAAVKLIITTHALGAATLY